MRAGLRTVLKCSAAAVATLVLLVALALGAFGYIVGRVPEYRVQVQDWVSERSGLVVEFSSLSARLRRYGPELVFEQPVVRTPDRTRVLASASHGSVGFDLWTSLSNGRLTAGRFSLDAPQLHLLLTRDGRLQLLGQSALGDRELKPIPLEYLPIGSFRVRDAIVSFRDERHGGGPWSLSGVSFTLQRSVADMALAGSAVLPNALGEQLHFTAHAAGALEDAQALATRFEVQGERLDLSGWAAAMPPHWPLPQSGRGSLEIRGSLRGAQFEELDAQVRMQDVLITPPVWADGLPMAAPLRGPDDRVPLTLARQAEMPAPLVYEQLAFKAQAHRLGTQWALTIDDLDARRADSQWQAQQLAARWSYENDALTLTASTDKIVIDSLWPLLAYLPQTESLARVRALQASGTLQDVQLSLQRSAGQVPKYSLQMAVQDLAVAPVETAPGISGLNGRIVADDTGGHWDLSARTPGFELPRMFRQPLTADSVDGTVRWQREARGWRVLSDELRLQAADGRGQVSIDLLLPDDGSSPVIDLRGTGEALQVAATSKYVLADKLRAPLLSWFDQAFVGGQVDQAQVRIRGPIRSFPFRHGEGEFLARGQVRDAHLIYLQQWQPLRQAAGEVEFRNEGMSATLRGGELGGMSVQQAQVQIADFREPLLQIQGTGQGDVGRGLKFLRDSPLGPVLGETFAALDGAGKLTAQVNLDLPLKDIDERRVEVTAQVHDARVSMRGVAVPVTALEGSLTVRNALVAEANLQGEWLEGPVQVSIEQRSAEHAMLTADGLAHAGSLRRLLGVPPAVTLAGQTPWRMSMRIDSADSPLAQQRTMHVESDLRGLQIGLPEPVGKSMQQSRALAVTLEMDGARSLLARASLDDVRALVRLRQSTQGWLLDRGSVRADAVTPALPAHRGLRIEGAVERFVLDDWLRLGSSGGTGRPLSDVLQAANVRIGELELFGYRWPQVRGILQATEGGWRVDVEGANAIGHVLIPERLTGDQPLRASMERLVLLTAQKDEGADESSEPLDPRTLPNMQVFIGDFHLGERSVGQVELRATRVSQGLRLDSVTAKGESAQGSAQGQWLYTVDGPQTSLKASVESNDVAATLHALGYTEFIEAKQGAVRADLSWPGGFEGNFLGRASGAISVDAQNGQLVNLQPGAGRVLGLFSVAALPRRLSLDFSDLTEKGLVFDSVHGDFELRQGDAYTSNLLLQGPAAEIGIAGRTGIGRRDYDQTAVVTGNLGASLPVAGVLAGGPAVGAALLLFSQVFKEPLKGITRGYYRITGPWDEPLVERVEAGDVKASTNDGL